MKVQTSDERVFKLKPLSKDAIDGALSKAEHYRLLNEPRLAESICLDILAADPNHQKASVVLLLALTDQFGSASSRAAKQALEIANKLADQYSRLYYTGIIHERQGSAAMNSGIPGADFDAFEWYMEAMDCYEKADALAPDRNDDTVLRWNTCPGILIMLF